MDQYREVVTIDEVPPDKFGDIIHALLEHFNVEIVREATPDYTLYEVRLKKPD